MTVIESKAKKAISADEVSMSPINWANLLGGPGTSLVGFPNKGIRILVASNPIGLSVGPVAVRAINP